MIPLAEYLSACAAAIAQFHLAAASAWVAWGEMLLEGE